jgi:hypothetical protein
MKYEALKTRVSEKESGRVKVQNTSGHGSICHSQCQMYVKGLHTGHQLLPTCRKVLPSRMQPACGLAIHDNTAVYTGTECQG